jgi:hypothetical protein
MAELKRDPVKYIRDRAKAKYEKGSSCEICDAGENLDFHHYYTLAPLLHKWLKEKKKIDSEYYSENSVVAWRDEFIQDNWQELYNDTVTLCHDHHLKLHSIYGRNPPLHTAKKQMRWVEIQREKHGMV